MTDKFVAWSLSDHDICWPVSGPNVCYFLIFPGRPRPDLTRTAPDSSLPDSFPSPLSPSLPSLTPPSLTPERLGRIWGGKSPRFPDFGKVGRESGREGGREEVGSQTVGSKGGRELGQEGVGSKGWLRRSYVYLSAQILPFAEQGQTWFHRVIKSTNYNE